MRLITTIEVDEIDTNIEVEFYPEYGGIEIASVYDESGNQVEITEFQRMILTDACHELAASL